MRARVGVAASLAAFALVGVAACGFGVDLDGLFDGTSDGDGGPDAPILDGGPDALVEAGIPSVEVEQLSLGSKLRLRPGIDGTVMCWGLSSSAVSSATR